MCRERNWLQGAGAGHAAGCSLWGAGHKTGCSSACGEQGEGCQGQALLQGTEHVAECRVWVPSG